MIRNTGSVMLRAVRIITGDVQIPGVDEKLVYTNTSAVPRTDTGALAEKAKTCKDNLVEGIRHI